MSRYGKRDDMIAHEEEPFNAETGLAALAEDLVTATDAFYVRGHGAVPEIDPAAWRLRVHGAVERELVLSLATLREALRERDVTATLQCAGNRRAGLIAIRDIPGEAPWGPGATGAATWTGRRVVPRCCSPSDIVRGGCLAEREACGDQLGEEIGCQELGDRIDRTGMLKSGYAVGW
jgi:hypothetical protein